MQSDQFIAISAFAETLYHYYQAKQTGTLYFVSTENRAGVINLKDGHIIALTYSSAHNEVALENLLQAGKVSYRFSESARTVNQPVQISTTAILNKLGFNLPATSVPRQSLPVENNLALRTDKLVAILEQVLAEISGKPELSAITRTTESYSPIVSFSQLAQLMDKIESGMNVSYRLQFRKLVSQRLITQVQPALRKLFDSEEPIKSTVNYGFSSSGLK